MRRLVLGLAVAVATVIPSLGNADDQQIAQFIKSRLQTEQQAGNLKGFNIDMRVDKGTVWFSGYVANTAQEELVLKTAQQAGHLGAVQIVDDIEVRTSVLASQPMPVQMAQPQMQVAQPQMATQPMAQQASYQESYPAPAQMTQGMTDAAPMPVAAMGQMGPVGSAPMPMPMAYSGDQGMGMGGAPSMPGYAWPGYAANPNYAAVTYPKQYSPSAWPYIGPFYPYPQVPMGWRRVELQWDDGWWFLDFHDR